MLLRTLCIILCTLSSFSLLARVRDFQTTRMIATSGTGIGSILITESSFLNPASAAFFKNSYFQYQKDSGEVEGDDKDMRPSSYGKMRNEAYIAADTSSELKGSFSYTKQVEDSHSRVRMSNSLARAIGQSTSLGTIVRYSHDWRGNKKHNDHYTQMVIGVTHIFNEKLSLGVTWTDPTMVKKSDYQFAAGLQYQLFTSLILMADAGANTQYAYEDTQFNRLALQLDLFSDLFVRAGTYYDKQTNLRGNSWGISWEAPKLSLHYAYQNSQAIKKNQDFLYGDEKLIVHSLAISLKI